MYRYPLPADRPQSLLRNNWHHSGKLVEGSCLVSLFKNCENGGGKVCHGSGGMRASDMTEQA
jgi:hypothetical protein